MSSRDTVKYVSQEPLRKSMEKCSLASTLSHRPAPLTFRPDGPDGPDDPDAGMKFQMSTSVMTRHCWDSPWDILTLKKKMKLIFSGPRKILAILKILPKIFSNSKDTAYPSWSNGRELTT